MSIYGSSNDNDITERLGPDPVSPPDFQQTAYADMSPHTVMHPAHDDSAGYTVPEQRAPGATQPTRMGHPTQAGQLTQTGPLTQSGPLIQTGPPTQTSPPTQAVRPPQQPGPAALPQRFPAQYVPAQYAPVPSGPASFGPNARSTGQSTSIRIGKGVTAAVKPARIRGNRPWWGYLTRILSWILTVVIIAVLLWTAWQWWQRRHNAAVVTTVTVAPAQLFNNQCGVQYDIVGTIATNGKAGTITYEWVRSDGQRSGPLKQDVTAGQRSATVHLFWKFTGEGTMNATATLHVLKPSAVDGSAQFVYSCR